MPDHNYFANLIWQIADLLRGPYRPPQYERVMLPMTVLRRFDCVLAPTKAKVLAEHAKRKGGKLEGDALDTNLNKAAGQRFHNHSPLDFEKLKGDLVRFMNDVPFQKIVTTWMASEAYRRLRTDARETVQGAGSIAPPPRLRIVEPTPEERYVTCVPLVPLKAAAGAFGDPQHIEDDGFEWVGLESRHRLRKGMFVAQVIGKSMEPAIPDGAYCLFRAPVEGTRQGKTVLVQLRDANDPETSQRYTVKCYESEKTTQDDGTSWHLRIVLKPLNPEFKPIVLTVDDEGTVNVVAELVEVMGV